MGSEGSRLPRRLGVVDATALALGAIIGAGVFVTLGAAAQSTGPALLVAVLLAAGVATLNGLSSAELGVADPLAGGTYEFAYRFAAPVVGFAAGWLFLFAAITAATTYTLTFASYLQPILPGVPLRALSVGLGAGMLAVNATGVDISRRVNNLLVALKVGVLLVFVALGILSSTRSVPLARLPAAGDLFQATALLFFAFTGYARPVTVVEELRDPRRDLPRAVVTALAVSTVLYLLVAVVALRLLDAAELAATRAPLRDALTGTAFPWAPNLISAGAVLTTATVLLTELWGLSRLAFAMARRGDLPRGLSPLSPRGVPLRALLVVGTIVIVLAATVDLTPALAASSLSLLLYYAITNATALRLSAGQRLYPRAVSAFGAVACLVLAASLPPDSVLVVGGVLGVGLLFFLLRRRR